MPTDNTKPSTDDAAISIFDSMQSEGFSLEEMVNIVQAVRGFVRDEFDAENERNTKAFEEQKRQLLSLKNAI